MEGQTIQQATLVALSAPKSSQVMVQLALFNADGSPVGFLTNEDFEDFLDTPVAASADAAALTSAVLTGGESPTEAEHNALRADVVATRTALNTFLANARTAGILAT